MKISELKNELKELLCNCSFNWNIFVDDKTVQLCLCNETKENMIFSEDIETVQNILNVKHFIITSSIIYEEGIPKDQIVIEFNHNIEFEKE